MKKLIFAWALLLLALPLQAADGMNVITSSHDVAVTVDRLEKIVTGAGFKVIARVNHGKAAQGVGIALKPVELLIFGKPKAGSLLMQSQPSVAIDLPMKFLVWEDASGKVNIGWNDPAWIAARHGITDKDKLVGKMTGALRKLATKGAGTD
ncbi:DUF302 domain-containing protein [Thiolapillus sp.]